MNNFIPIKKCNVKRLLLICDFGSMEKNCNKDNSTCNIEFFFHQWFYFRNAFF